MSSLRIGYALTGSFCTFEKSIEQLRLLVEEGYKILPIMSYNAYQTDTRFGKADDFIWEIEDICNHKILKTIVDTEPIGPKKLVDLMIVAPCTSNTLAKIANGITDTPVTMAVKSHLRLGGPVLLALASNDALAASAQNLAKLMNAKHIYFVPMRQDDPINKPTSLVADFTQLLPAALRALEEKQLQPVFCP